MPSAPVVVDGQAVGDEDGMLDEVGSMNRGYMMDSVAPGSSMLMEVLKMAMESEAGSSTPQNHSYAGSRPQ